MGWKEGFVNYFLFLSASSVFIFFCIHLSTRFFAGIKSGRLHKFLCIAMIPVALMMHGIGEFLVPISPTQEEFELIESGKMADPGPAAAVRAFNFGFMPAAVYALISLPLYWVLQKTFKK